MFLSMNKIQKIGEYTLIFHIIILFFVLIIGRFATYTDEALAVIVAITLPILVSYGDKVVSFFTQNRTQALRTDIANDRLNANIRIFTIIGVGYAFAVIFVLGMQAIKPVSLINFIGTLGLIGTLKK